MEKILEFKEATRDEEAAAQRVSKVVGEYFTFNLPLQIKMLDEGDNAIQILNYMPRRGNCAWISLSEIGFHDKCTPEELKLFKDFCDTTIACLKNLARQWEKFRDGAIDGVYYPNCSD